MQFKDVLVKGKPVSERFEQWKNACGKGLDYGTAPFFFAQIWAERIEEKLQDPKVTLAEVAPICADEISKSNNLLSLTGAQGMVVPHLMNWAWKYNDIFREWYNSNPTNHWSGKSKHQKDMLPPDYNDWHEKD